MVSKVVITKRAQEQLDDPIRNQFFHFSFLAFCFILYN